MSRIQTGAQVADIASSPGVYGKLRHLPRGHQGSDLVPQAVLRPPPVPLARARSLPGLSLVG